MHPPSIKLFILKVFLDLPTYSITSKINASTLLMSVLAGLIIFELIFYLKFEIPHLRHLL